ncbi:MAG TPA: response regulator [Alphaproteobacteria bacterium]|jgi:FixJ family two-component response regulator|nr:response regulator [Alphaproteobacteria bacterium]
MSAGLRVAVVDDDPSVRKALRRLLHALALEVDAYTTGQEFLDSLQLHRPDCLVLDLHMPGMSGLDVMRLVNEKKPKLPVIVITGHDEPDTRLKCMSAGAAAYLPKPVDDWVLLEAITRSVGSR